MSAAFPDGHRAALLTPITVTQVTIDINPGKFPNNISLASARVLPVAIISTETFDATKVDPATVTLASADVRHVDRKRKATKYSCQQTDVNSDGLPDLLCKVETAEMIVPGDFVAVLEGKTFAGERIRGEDQLVIVQ